jgi:hypothetical protein
VLELARHLHLDEEQTRMLLQTSLTGLSSYWQVPDQSLDEIPPDILGAAQTLVKATDGLPLALDQAGAYLEQTGSTLADYLHLFERHRMRLLAERPAAVVLTAASGCHSRGADPRGSKSVEDAAWRDGQ